MFTGTGASIQPSYGNQKVLIVMRKMRWWLQSLLLKTVQKYFLHLSLEVDNRCDLIIYICMNPVTFILVDTEGECFRNRASFCTSLRSDIQPVTSATMTELLFLISQSRHMLWYTVSQTHNFVVHILSNSLLHGNPYIWLYIIYTLEEVSLNKLKIKKLKTVMST